MFVKEEKENFMKLRFLDTYLLGHKGFIAGGCFKNIFNNEKIKDIDIFFNNDSDFEDAVRYYDTMTPNYNGEDIRELRYNFYYENKNVKAYRNIDSGIVIELCRKIFGKPDDILNQFDFSITKFAYYKEVVRDEPIKDGFLKSKFMKSNPVESEHLEDKILYSDKFFEHLHMKKLVTDDKILYPASTFERMIKYISYGYLPCRETKLKILTAINELEKSELILSKSLYDGID